MVYATAATLGSIAGCLLLYYRRPQGRRVHHAAVQPQRVERALPIFRRYGVMAVLIPSLLPPPAPFKIFVLLAGVAGISVGRFITAIAIGRGIRYFGEGAWRCGTATGRWSSCARIAALCRLPSSSWSSPDSSGICSGRSRAMVSGNRILAPMIELSVVIPIRNEAPGLEELHRELTQTLEAWGRSYEIIVVDDGSTDDSFAILARLQARDPHWRVIRFRRNFGQTAAFSAGFAHARGRLIVTSDGDLQNDPRDIPAMVRKLEDEQLDIVCGWRRNRKDAFLSRLLPSMVANRLISWATGVRLHDYGCSLKVFRAEVVKPLKLYGEMHRFIPAIASEQGVAIAEVVVNHRARRHGTSKYGISRTVRVILDLLTVKFLLSYSTRPVQIFGLIGLAMALPGSLITGLPGVRPPVRRSVDRQPSAAAVRHPAGLHRRAAHHARPARRAAGAHVSRIAGQADLCHSRNPRGATAARGGR